MKAIKSLKIAMVDILPNCLRTYSFPIIVIGLFSVNLKKAEEKSARIAEVQAYQLQAKMLAGQALHMAVRSLPRGKKGKLPPPRYFKTEEGTLVFIVNDTGLPKDQRRIVSYGVVKDVWVVQTTIVKKLAPDTKPSAGAQVAGQPEHGKSSQSR